MSSPSPTPSKLGPPSSTRSGSVYLITSDGRIINLPVPSASRLDPLNWSFKKRALAFLTIGVFSFVGLVLPQGASLAMNGLFMEFSPKDTAPFDVETVISAPTFFMGLGAFVWIPMTMWLGRRPVLVFCAVLMLLATLFAAFATTFYVLLAAVCVLGLTEGFSLSAALLILIDLTFIHQRPHAIAMVWSIIGFTASSSLASVPFMTNDGMDWRSFYKYWTIPAGISCIMAILFFPETYFKRPAVAFDGRLVVQSAEENIEIYEDHEDDFPDKVLPNTPQQALHRRIFERFTLPRATADRWRAMMRCYPQILGCFLNPLIFWIALLNAIEFAGMLFIGETYAQVLRKPPYELNSHLIVLVSVSSGFGSLLAWPTSGPLVSRLLKSLTHRNKGVREAEHYLVAFILPVLTSAASAALYGIAVSRSWHFAFIYLAYGLNGLAFAGQAIANTLWVTEAFPPWAAPALVVVGGVSYMLSFGMSFVIMPWIKAQGFMKVGVELGALQLGLGLIVVPVAFWGKSARQYINGRWGEWRDGALRPW